MNINSISDEKPSTIVGLVTPLVDDRNPLESIKMVDIQENSLTIEPTIDFTYPQNESQEKSLEVGQFLTSLTAVPNIINENTHGIFELPETKLKNRKFMIHNRKGSKSKNIQAKP